MAVTKSHVFNGLCLRGYTLLIGTRSNFCPIDGNFIVNFDLVWGQFYLVAVGYITDISGNFYAYDFRVYTSTV